MEPQKGEAGEVIVQGARVHNLKNIDVTIPRNKLTVITGLSGSGKSSLAFDTIYTEGQRRYIETFSAYARQFMGNMERPDVDKITGLSPVISIEQKSTNRNPRSTVGTITEIYDFLRLLYARASIAYSYNTGEEMVRYTEEQIVRLIENDFLNKKTAILSPIVRGRKGHYRELFEQLQRKGFLYVRINGEITEIRPGMKLDRYKIHHIELLIDKLPVSNEDSKRLASSVATAMNHGKGTIMVLDMESQSIRYYSRNLMCPTTGISYDEPAPHSFSFNSPRGACPRCNGLGTVAEADIKRVIPDPKLSIKKGGIQPLGPYKSSLIFWQLDAIAQKYGFDLNDPIESIPEDALNVILYGSEEQFTLKHQSLGVKSNYFLSFEGIISYIQNIHNEDLNGHGPKWAQQFIQYAVCPVCHGTRLKDEVKWFRVDGKDITQLSRMDIETLTQWFDKLEDRLNNRQKAIATELLKEIRERLTFLMDVGLGYLSLGRGAASLSGGESQRIRLATQIGSKLVNVLYILDEPSIGLHQRDNIRLIDSLRQLRDSGNSVIVVEHDEEMILSADHVVDMGPKAGRHGGQIVATGTPKEIAKSNSLTACYISHKKRIPIPKSRRERNGKSLVLIGAKGNNLKDITVEFPLGLFICVTGVSGSGKSTLVNETLRPLLSKALYRSFDEPLEYKSIHGLEHIDKVVEVNQAPIGRTPRSNPATYTGVFTDIRKLFELTPEAKIRGYKAGRFSFNVKGGRCETCKGAGVQTIEMNFLPDVYVTCKDCDGLRYNRETLEVKYKGKSISDIFSMTINQAVEFFGSIPHILQKVKTLQEVGLGYLTLGQPSTTLSGGESQRVKLSTELSKRDSGRTLYILDEPTTGLHFEDVRVLLDVLNRLVDKGNTVIVIEHNMDVVKVADHIIDLGPEGGEKGGEVVCAGTPEEIMKKGIGYTAKYLKRHIERKK
ncbi:MAG TPA: excinuclease ABC subunit UvrA [Tenuifilaceae bacterium]|jgi:excinuclease ABC subunit A|nr:excinuclease ABC subunit UvrA [Bacteroidales bacterium]MDI9516992.1 excinuclease ABC subunit UvrA [Bacteroidota bacterium]OQC61150.1 MAG: UvrABC system protein A [Bacteroidetes bacterium ADurb.Bin008]HNV81501.1 excinuclease ABC subunit UvrA [Tenuifilaceae bacterium]MZP81612.1 excinuclease ABC subunit UvrA [Bacteroidales bacterium]